MTAAGLERLVVEPSPSWPSVLSPHARTVPSAFNAITCEKPEAMAMMPVAPATTLGVADASERPTPSWPDASLPQLRMVPSALSATLWLLPALMAGVAATAKGEKSTSETKIANVHNSLRVRVFRFASLVSATPNLPNSSMEVVYSRSAFHKMITTAFDVFSTPAVTRTRVGNYRFALNCRGRARHEKIAPMICRAQLRAKLHNSSTGAPLQGISA